VPQVLMNVNPMQLWFSFLCAGKIQVRGVSPVCELVKKLTFPVLQYIKLLHWKLQQELGTLEHFPYNRRMICCQLASVHFKV
jgi:hypothetical protein